MSDHANEHVLVVPRALFDDLGAFHGFQPDTQAYLPALLDPGNNHFLSRDLAEDDPTHKQIIPYAIFRFEDRILHYVRGSRSGEQRLASKGSIGIGGHVNEEDFHASGSLGRELYLTGVDREINEELSISTGYTQSIAGLINDDSSEVGQVHLGVVHLFTLDSPGVTSNEDNITQLEFLTRKELEDRIDQLESWSRLIVENIDTVLTTDTELVH